MQGRNNRYSSDELWNHAELDQVFWLELVEQRRTRIFRFNADIAVETHRAADSESTLDDLVEADKGSATNEQDMRRVDLRELLMRMFSPSLRRNIGDCSFEHLQQCLLNAFTRHIACDGWIFVLPAD